MIIMANDYSTWWFQKRLIWLFYQFQQQQHQSQCYYHHHHYHQQQQHCDCHCKYHHHHSCSSSSSSSFILNQNSDFSLNSHPSTSLPTSRLMNNSEIYSRTTTTTVTIDNDNNHRSHNKQNSEKCSYLSRIIINHNTNSHNQPTTRRIRPKSLLSLPLTLSLFQWTILLLVVMLFNSQLIDACGPGRGGSRRRSPRKLMPLVFKQHVPNVSENTLGASGLNEGPITRNHKRFKELVPNYNQDILFKDEEGTGADRLMTQRLKEKLNTLAISVMNQWPGVRLRVTEGWDEDGSHASNSLHYEGRAVDITTSDRDRSKYGMLARLAVEAGFDWVYYESRFHIHCSVKSEKSESARNGGCFDETSLVQTRNNGSLNIQQLKIGDEILTLNPMNGKYEYSPVIMFLDRDPETERLYYEFETENGSKITTTPSHLLFVSDDNNLSNIKNNTPIVNLLREEFAKNIYIGQYLFLSNGFASRTRLERIVNIRTKLSRGAYAPLTETGNLVINNITASCYAVVRSQTISHWSFLPTRFLYSFQKLGDHLSEFLHVKSTNDRNQDQSIGIHWYPKILYEIFRYFIPKDFIYN